MFDRDITDMFRPVRCRRCHSGVYDLGTVTVTARYADCSMWKTPCCDQLVDDRGETGWTSRKDYERIDKTKSYVYGVDMHGRPVIGHG